MDLEHTMLRERSQTQKAALCVIPLMWRVRHRRVHGAGRRVRVAGGWGGTCRKCSTSTGVWISFWVSETFWNSIVGMLARHFKCTETNKKNFFFKKGRSFWKYSNIWKLSNTLLSHLWPKHKSKEKIIISIWMKVKTMYQKVWYVAKAVQHRNFIGLNAFITKKTVSNQWPMYPP